MAGEMAGDLAGELWDIWDKARVLTPVLRDHSQATYQLAVYAMRPALRARYLRCMATIEVIRALYVAQHWRRTRLV